MEDAVCSAEASLKSLSIHFTIDCGLLAFKQSQVLVFGADHAGYAKRFVNSVADLLRLHSHDSCYIFPEAHGTTCNRGCRQDAGAIGCPCKDKDSTCADDKVQSLHWPGTWSQALCTRIIRLDRSGREL